MKFSTKEKIFIILFFIWLFYGCAETNKKHWQKIHPHGGWAGKHWLPGQDTSKKGGSNENLK